MPRKPILYTALLFIILSCSRDTEEFELQEDLILLEEVIEEETVTEADLPAEAVMAFNWIENLQFSNGLLESAENTNFVSLYDNALSALAFMAMGEIEKAEKILDYFNDRIESELLHDKGGFYQFRNGQGGEKRTIWLGDNAWLLIAIHNYHSITAGSKYNSLAIELENWIRSLQEPDGGIRGGYYEDGTPIHVVTEGMITAFNAVSGYDDFHRSSLEYIENNRWNTSDELLVAWPDNNSYYYAMDLHSLGYMVLEDYPLSALEQADRYINTQLSSASGEELWGYCFDEDRDVIWLEGTGQMGLAFKDAGMITKANEINIQLSKAGFNTNLENQFNGLPYTTNAGSGYGAVPLWDHADSKGALSSTVWYLFNILDFNPLARGKSKSIPVSDKFWLQ